EPGGSCGIGLALVSTLCEVEILTTASITFSATSAIFSGPRAWAGAESIGSAKAAAAIAARTGRRTTHGRVRAMGSNLLKIAFSGIREPEPAPEFILSPKP